ncbi:MAG: hypothetical protein HW403_1016 [Dehalococcoidia bacterium]|nr:hypothetical protein [Dehalococcoidia bacterium]
MSKCPFCKGMLETKNVTRAQSFEDRVLILTNVQALVCRQCGEVFLSPDVLKQVQQVVCTSVAPDEVREVPVYDMSGRVH